jgi:ketosteroid isomerase-like protein
MKKLILFFAISVSLVACTSSTSSNEQKDKENLELVSKYVKAVEAMDFAAMENYLADDYVGYGPSFGDTIYKKQAIENWKSNVENLYESIRYNRQKMAPVTIADGNNKGEWVGVWAELKIVYKNDGGEVTIWANSDYLVENGKIKSSFTFYNEADALRQLGYKLVPADQ